MNLLELVPRDLDVFLDEATLITSQVPQIEGINVPDVLRLSTRSYIAAKHLLERQIRAIPHIRSGDQNMVDVLSTIGVLLNKGLKEILIVSGDRESGGREPLYSALQLIEAVRLRYPNLMIYGALDPYRQSFLKELAYCQEKLDAGVNGFFTQPFFDVELARVFLEQLPAEAAVFLGISPVITEQSKTYWIKQNKAIFPRGFELDLLYNCQLAAKLVQLANAFGQNTYMMPIRVNPLTFARQTFALLG